MNQHLVLYDGECPLCIFQMRLLTWLDWCNALALIPLTDPRAQQAAPQFDREQLLAAMHCVTKDGRILLRHSVPMKDPSGVTRVWFFRDITLQERAFEALRSSESQQRAVMDAFPGYVAVIDARFVYRYVNQRQASLIGLDPADIVGRHMPDVIGEERFAEIVEGFIEGLKIGIFLNQIVKNERGILKVSHAEIDFGIDQPPGGGIGRDGP